MALCVYIAFFLPLTFIKSAKFSLEVPFIGKVIVIGALSCLSKRGTRTLDLQSLHFKDVTFSL